MKIIQIIILLFLATQTGKAQHQSRFDFSLGYGYYEGFNIGSEYNFKSGKQSISASIGYDKWTNRNQENKALHMGYDFAIFQRHKNRYDEYKWHITNKLVLWQLDDDSYTWKAVSFIPSINRKFVMNRKIRMSIGVGPSFTIVLYNKRKTYKDVGWPYHVMPNFSILFHY